MSVICNQYVLRFELPVNDSLLVQKLNSDYYLWEHVSDGIFGEDEVLFSGVEVEIALRQVLHDDVDVFFVLEDLDDVGEKGVFAYGGNEFGL